MIRWPNDNEVSPHAPFRHQRACSKRVHLGPLSYQGNRPSNKQTNKRFGFSAVCLHFTAVWIKFAEKVSVIKSKSFHSTTVNLLFVNCPKKSNVKNFQLFYCLANVAIDLPSKPISSQITWYSVTSQFTFFGTRIFPWIWNPWTQNSQFSSQFTLE